MKARAHCFSRRRGATALEMAFVLSVTLIITFAIYDYCRYFMLSQLVNNAAREGARQAVATTNTQNTAAIQNTVVQYMANQSFVNTSGQAFSASNVVVIQVNPATGAPTSPDSNWYDAAFGSSIMVQVNAKFTPLFPTFGFLPSVVNLRGTAVMSSEAN
jgi:Flp pilus assembly protein TadG